MTLIAYMLVAISVVNGEPHAKDLGVFYDQVSCETAIDAEKKLYYNPKINYDMMCVEIGYRLSEDD